MSNNVSETPDEPKPPAELARDLSQQKSVKNNASASKGSRLTAYKQPHNVHAYYGPPPQDYKVLQDTNVPETAESKEHSNVLPPTPLENGYSVPNYRPPGWLDGSTIPGPTRTLDSDQGTTTHPGPPLSAIKSGKVTAVCDPHLQILCGPLLRYDTVKDGMWHGAVMIVTNDTESIYHPVPTLTVDWEAEDVAPYTPESELEGGGGIGDPVGEKPIIGAQSGEVSTKSGTTSTQVSTPSTTPVPPTPPPKPSSGKKSSDSPSSSSSDSSSDSDNEPTSPSKSTPKGKKVKAPAATWAGSMIRKLKELAPQGPSDFRGRPPERTARTQEEKRAKQISATMRVIEGEAIYKYTGIASTSTFWRFMIEVPVNPDPKRGIKVYYAINKPKKHFDLHLGGHRARRPTDIAFHIASIGSDMRFAAYSCNGFSEGIDPNLFKGEGFESGFDPVWADLLQRHSERPFHALVGGGDQLYCDSLMKEPELQEYVKLRNHQEKVGYPLNDSIMFTMDRYYFNHYCLVFRNGCFARAISEIPMVNMLDDHDLIDGFGSYPEELQRSAFFKHIGSRGYFWFLLFQQFTVDSVDGTLIEPGQHTFKSTIIGADGPYIPFPSHSTLHWFGAHTWMLMLDCRAERRKDLIVSPETYQQIFSILRELPESVDHLIVQLGIPIAYPRMNLAERIIHSDGILAKITRSGYFSSLANKYNKDMELLDDLSDHWTAKDHKRERNWLISQLQLIALERRIRISFISGDVHLAAVGLLKTYAGKTKQFQHGRGEVQPSLDHRWMLNIVSSAIVNTPPPPAAQATLNMLATHKHRTMHHEHTDEVMLPVFMEGLRTDTRHLNYVAGARNYTIGERDPTNGEFVFDIRVERRQGEGETKGYTVRAPPPEWAPGQEARKIGVSVRTLAVLRAKDPRVCSTMIESKSFISDMTSSPTLKSPYAGITYLRLAASIKRTALSDVFTLKPTPSPSYQSTNQPLHIIMPLFRSSRPVEPVAPVEDTPVTRKGSIFSSRRQVVSPADTPTTTSNRSNRYSTDNGSPTTRTSRGGFFSRRRNSSGSDLSDRRTNNHAVAAGTGAGTGTGFFGGSRMRDPTLDNARGKVQAAELAEKEADRALIAARGAVIEAKRHVQILEREANEQARLAEAKVLATRGIKGDASHLGRHS